MVVTALREAGLQVETGDGHFAQNAPDVEWLPVVGQRGWVLLTKDKAIRTNVLERTALVANQVAAFMLGGGNLPGAEMARIFITSMRSMERAFPRCRLVRTPRSARGMRSTVASRGSLA